METTPRHNRAWPSWARSSPSLPLQPVCRFLIVTRSTRTLRMRMTRWRPSNKYSRTPWSWVVLSCNSLTCIVGSKQFTNSAFTTSGSFKLLWAYVPITVSNGWATAAPALAWFKSCFNQDLFCCKNKWARKAWSPTEWAYRWWRVSIIAIWKLERPSLRSSGTSRGNWVKNFLNGNIKVSFKANLKKRFKVWKINIS